MTELSSFQNLLGSLESPDSFEMESPKATKVSLYNVESEPLTLSPQPRRNKMAMCDAHRLKKGSCGAVKPQNQLHPCGGCLSKYYCGPECQRKDWVLHSKECKELNAKRLRKLERERRREKKLLKAKKEAEENQQGFNASLSLMLMSDSEGSSSDDCSDLYASKTSLTNSKTSLSTSKNSLKHKQQQNDDDGSEEGSLVMSYLAGSMSQLKMSPTKERSRRQAL